MHQFDFGWGSALAGCKGSYLSGKWRDGIEKEGDGEEGGERKVAWPLRGGDGEAKGRWTEGEE